MSNHFERYEKEKLENKSGSDKNSRNESGASEGIFQLSEKKNNGTNVSGSGILPLGKLKTSLLRKIFSLYNSPEIMGDLDKYNTREYYEKAKKRVVLGFGIGEDASLIDMGENYLIVKTDPITFATNYIGYYVVNVNSNDIASMGGVPKWFQVTILLPEGKTTESMAERICLDIQKACIDKGIVLIGGHTEVTYNLDRPIIIGSMLGEVKKTKFVKTGGARPGDVIILTKGIPIEGTSIIALEKEEELLKKGISAEFIASAKNLLFSPGISVLKEAIIANNNFEIHSMHDPTEGGLAMGLAEMAMASKLGLKIYYDKIKIIPEGKKLCELYNLDPLKVISSGALLIALDKDDGENLVEVLKKNGIDAEIIGEFIDQEGDYKIFKGNEWHDLESSETDEITKIL